MVRPFSIRDRQAEADVYYVGLEMNEKGVRLCVYNKITKDADTIMVHHGSSRALSPARMAYSVEDRQWKYGVEAEYFAEQKGYVLFDNILERCSSARNFEENGQVYPCETVMGELIKHAVSYAGIREAKEQIAVLVVTVPTVTRALASVVESAFEYVGFKGGQAYLQSFEESFFAFTFFQKADVSSRDVGMFYFIQDQVKYSRLHTDVKTKPSTVSVCDDAYETLPLEDKEKDACLEDFIKKTTDGHEFSSFFLVGDGFNRKWANNSLRLLCKSQRKVFYGNNLFTKGACFAAYEKAHPEKLKSKLFLGKDLITKSIGMDMLVDGIAVHRPLISSGINWFDAENSCDILLNGEKSLVFRTSRLEDGKRQNLSMELPGLPERPDKTTRLHIELRFESVDKCAVTVKDLGFGEIFPSSGKIWTDYL